MSSPFLTDVNLRCRNVGELRGRADCGRLGVPACAVHNPCLIRGAI